MHLDPPIAAVPHRLVRPVHEVEVPEQLAVDARQEVLVERRGDPHRIVVGTHDQRLGLDQVGRQEQAVVGLELGAHAAQERLARRAVEVADGRAEDQDEQLLSRRPAVGHGGQPVQVLGLVAHDAHAFDRAQLLLRLLERRARDVDRVIEDGLAQGKRLEHEARLLAAARPQLGDERRPRHAGHHLVGVLGEQARVRPGEAVFGQQADGLEQGRADVVVEVLRQELLLAGPGEAHAHVLGERRGCDRRNERVDHAGAP